jgi:hypothetical protein
MHRTTLERNYGNNKEANTGGNHSCLYGVDFELKREILGHP